MSTDIRVGDIITYKEVFGIFNDIMEKVLETKNKSIPSNWVHANLDMRKLVLVCKNCDRKDCLEAFRVKKKIKKQRTLDGWDDYTRRIIKPSPNRIWTKPKYTISSNSNTTKSKGTPIGVATNSSKKGGTVNVNTYGTSTTIDYWDEAGPWPFEDFLKCPKCNSRMICITEEAVSWIVAERL